MKVSLHIKVVSERKGIFWTCKPAQVDIEAISETTAVKANQQVSDQRRSKRN